MDILDFTSNTNISSGSSSSNINDSNNSTAKSISNARKTKANQAITATTTKKRTDNRTYEKQSTSSSSANQQQKKSNNDKRSTSRNNNGSSSSSRSRSNGNNGNSNSNNNNNRSSSKKKTNNSRTISDSSSMKTPAAISEGNAEVATTATTIAAAAADEEEDGGSSNSSNNRKNSNQDSNHYRRRRRRPPHHHHHHHRVNIADSDTDELENEEKEGGEATDKDDDEEEEEEESEEEDDEEEEEEELEEQDQEVESEMEDEEEEKEELHDEEIESNGRAPGDVLSDKGTGSTNSNAGSTTGTPAPGSGASKLSHRMDAVSFLANISLMGVLSSPQAGATGGGIIPGSTEKERETTKEKERESSASSRTRDLAQSFLSNLTTSTTPAPPPDLDYATPPVNRAIFAENASVQALKSVSMTDIGGSTTEGKRPTMVVETPTKFPGSTDGPASPLKTTAAADDVTFQGQVEDTLALSSTTEAGEASAGISKKASRGRPKKDSTDYFTSEATTSGTPVAAAAAAATEAEGESADKTIRSSNSKLLHSENNGEAVGTSAATTTDATSTTTTQKKKKKPHHKSRRKKYHKPIPSMLHLPEDIPRLGKTDEEINTAFQNCKKISNWDASRYRMDSCDNVIAFVEYGNKKSEFGWGMEPGTNEAFQVDQLEMVLNNVPRKDPKLLNKAGLSPRQVRNKMEKTAAEEEPPGETKQQQHTIGNMIFPKRGKRKAKVKLTEADRQVKYDDLDTLFGDQSTSSTTGRRPSGEAAAATNDALATEETPKQISLLTRDVIKGTVSSPAPSTATTTQLLDPNYQSTSYSLRLASSQLSISDGQEFSSHSRKIYTTSMKHIFTPDANKYRRVLFTTKGEGLPFAVYSLLLPENIATRRTRTQSKTEYDIQKHIKKKNGSFDFLLEKTEQEPYHPDFLDDPELRTGKHRTLMNLPFSLGSIIHYVRPSELKRELNEQFREAHPDLDPTMTLSKLRKLKQDLIKIATSPLKLELCTVAYAIVYLEKLVLKNRVNKSNRKEVAAACLLLACKINESRVKQEHFFTQMYEQFESVLDVSKNEVRNAEFETFVALDFHLHVSLPEILPHFLRLLEHLDFSSIHEYLGGESFSMYTIAHSLPSTQEESLVFEKIH